ncbi:uncharacterized protein LOC111272281 [Varroa jacobsoni]|uniref:Uncharacterized protein n=1 Tax=Varroa destructor TaxID=109461 RepID=A0A7M7IWN0_VARDE|nr:uncharacterized protein LOC111242883 [Varroa destructor]XP_022709372.1 uncharacterized protein LOC111272281 [Varroa jacobsoni]
MSPHADDGTLQFCSPVRKPISLSHIGSQILSSNFKYLKTVDGFIKLIHVVLCLYCGVSMLNTCHPTAVNNQQLPGHLSCTSRQINFILTHLSAFVLHSVILLSYLLSPLSSVLLPSTILELIAGCISFTCGLSSSILLMSAMALLDLPAGVNTGIGTALSLSERTDNASLQQLLSTQSIENTLSTSALGITTSLLCMACILRNYISLRRNINYDLLLKPTA